MTAPWEEFFIRKIKDGLAVSSNSLSADEERLLRKLVTEFLDEQPISPEQAQRLDAKCIDALREAYARDTAGKNKQAALQWRENNEALYKHSRLVVSGIVQNWYLRTGRGQEKKVLWSLRTVLIFVAIAVVFLVWLVISSAGK